MQDELDLRVVRALRAEADTFTLTVTAQQIEDRLARTTGAPWLLPVAAVLGVAAILIVVLGIGLGRGLPIGDPSRLPTESAALPDDPCALLTAAEIAAVTDDEVADGRIGSDEERIDPSSSPPCVYDTDGRHGRLSVTVDPTGAAAFGAWRDANRGPNLVSFPGLGDEAYSHGGASIHVKVGAGYFAISSQHGTAAGRREAEDLERLARLALMRIGAARPAVTELPAGTWVSRSPFRNGTICVAIEVQQPVAAAHRAWWWHPGDSRDCDSRSSSIVDAEAMTDELPLVRITLPAAPSGSETLSLRFTGFTEDGFTLDTVLFREVEQVDPVESP